MLDSEEEAEALCLGRIGPWQTISVYRLKGRLHGWFQRPWAPGDRARNRGKFRNIHIEIPRDALLAEQMGPAHIPLAVAIELKGYSQPHEAQEKIRRLRLTRVLARRFASAA